MRKQLNWKFLGVLSAVLAVSAVVVAAVHACQMSRHAAALMEEVNRAESDGRLDREAVYLQRYLLFAPGDVDALVRYGRLLDKTADGPGGDWRVVSVFDKVLSRDPLRHEVRRRLVELAMELGAFDLARDHLGVLLRYQPDQPELEDLLGQCQEALGDPEMAEASYRRAIDHDKARVASYVRLAELLQGRLNLSVQAGQVLDDLIDANDQAPEAYLARAAYRTAHVSLEEAAKDVARARELAPNDAAVLLAAADLAFRRGDRDEARKCLRRGRELHPDDVTLCAALATLELQCDRPRDAADCLREGLKATPRQADLLHLLAEALLRQDDEPGVEKTINQAREDGDDGLAVYLTARLQMHRKQWAEAAQGLEDLVKGYLLMPELAARARLCLGECYERLGDGDRRLAVLREAVELAPESAAARLGLGAALLNVGRTDEALTHLRRLSGQSQAPEAVWPLLGRALLLHTQGQPPARRDWLETERVLDRAAQAPEQAEAAALLRAEVLYAQNRPDEAEAGLARERARRPDQPGPWIAQAVLAARRGDSAAAARILDEARRQVGDRAELRLAVLELLAEPEEEGGGKALAALEQDLDKLPAEDQTRVLSRLAEAYYRLGKIADGDRVCRRLVDLAPADLPGRLLALDAAVQSGDDSLANGVLADVRRLEGADGVWQRYGEAARRIIRAQRGDKTGLGEARKLLAEAVASRPDWSRLALLQAQLDELDGDAGRAADGYLRAFDLGERRLELVGRLVTLLAQRGHWDDADRVVRKLQEQTAPRGGLARVATEVALQRRDFDRALDLARLAAPAGADAYAYHVWLGRVFAAADRPEEAEGELRRATKFPDAGWDAWAALAAQLARADRPQEADAAIEELKAKLPERDAALPLAFCCEAAGRMDRADAYYQEALRRRPNDALALLRAASFDIRLNRPAQAEPLLRRLLEPATAAPAENVAWARRRLAMVLAASGDAGKYAEAEELVGRDPGVEDRRARAVVLGARPEGRVEAIRILEESQKESPLAADERLRLAQLYEAANDWPKAREQILGLITLDKQNPEYLAYYVAALLGRDQAEEARPWAARLEKLEPASPRVKEFKSRLAREAGQPKPD